MTIAEQIATYLDAQGLGDYAASSVSSTIFIDMLPGKTDVISVYNRTGEYEQTKHGYRRDGIQIIYRGTKNPINSYTKAEAVFNALHGFSGNLVAGQSYVTSVVSVQGGPECIGRDTADNHEYSMNFVIDHKYKEV